MKNNKIIQNNIRLLLVKYPSLRSIYQRKQLHLYYWREFDNKEIGELMFNYLMKIYPKLTSAETLSRATRKTMEEFPELKPTQEQELKRYEIAEIYRKDYKKKYENRQ